MIDRIPACASHHPGHAPFWLRVRHHLNDEGRFLRLSDVEGSLVTLVEENTVSTYWTHPRGAALLERYLDMSRVEGVMYRDIYLLDGMAFSLIDPSEATPCSAPREAEESAPHPRTISVRSGWGWSPDDELAKRKRGQFGR